MIRTISNLGWRRLTAVWLVLAATMLTASTQTAAAIDDFAVQEAFVQKLIEQKWQDLAHAQVDEMAKEFAKEGERLALLRADIYISQRKRAEALKELDKVKKGPNYASTLLLRARLEEDPGDREKAYSEYFRVIGTPKSDKDKRDFQRAVLLSARNLMEADRIDDAVARLKFLTKVADTGGDENDPAVKAKMRQVKYERAKLLLGFAEEARDDGKSPKDYKAFVEIAQKDLDDLLWDLDYLAALGYVEISRAHILMGNPDAAIKQMNDTGMLEFLGSIEKVVQEQLGMGASPLAGIHFYHGDARMDRAKATASKGKNEKNEEKRATLRDEVVEDLTKAAHSYFRVATTYKQSPYGKDAIARLSDAKDRLAEFGVNIVLDDGAEITVIVEKAKELFKAKDFQGAAEKFEEAVKMNLGARNVPELGNMLIISYLQGGNYLSASVYADFLGAQFPEDPNTHKSLYVTGAILSKLSKDAEKAGNAALAEAHRGFANVAFIRLMEVAPAYPQASAAGWQVAETYYREGMEARSAASAAEERGDKAGASLQHDIMVREFNNAIKVYEALTLNFGTSAEGRMSYYKLGWVYMFLERDEEAATAFKLYTQADERPTEQRAVAKFYAAERYMRAGATEESIEHFTEFIAWTSAGGQMKATDKLLLMREDAEAYISWVKDKRTEVMAERKAYFDKEIAALEADIASGDAEKAYLAQKAEMKEQGDNLPTPADRLATLKAGRDQAELQRVALEEEAIKGFMAYVDEYPQNDRHTPSIMTKLSSMYAARGDTDKAMDWLLTLQKSFPNTPQGEASMFRLFVMLLENDREEEATAMAGDFLKQLPDLATPNVNQLADMMIGTDPKTKEPKVMHEGLAVAANEELIKRAKKDEKNNTLTGLALISHYRIARVYRINKKWNETIEAVDAAIASNPKTPLFYQLQIIKGEALAAVDRLPDAITVYGEALKSIDGTKYKKEYFQLVEAGIRLQVNEQRNATEVKMAVGEGLKMAKYYDLNDPDVQPYIESILYHLAKGLSLVGEKDMAVKYQAEYRQRYPEGKYQRDILKLPNAKF